GGADLLQGTEDRVGPSFGGGGRELRMLDRVDDLGSVPGGGEALGGFGHRGAEHPEVQRGAGFLGEPASGSDGRQARPAHLPIGSFDDDEDDTHRTLASVLSFSTSSSGEPTF